jgi:hypothetical protein
MTIAKGFFFDLFTRYGDATLWIGKKPNHGR